jgi:lipid-A-disaccharide synthase
VRERHPGWTLHAVGGSRLGAEAEQSPGGRWLGDSSDLSAMGIYSAVTVYPRAHALSWRMRKFVSANRIDAAVLCDWGAFNCRHLKFFKKKGVPVLYYFPPGSWRRTGSGGLGIAPLVDRVATPFEWSARRLAGAGCKAEWVGHPMLEQRLDPAHRAALRREFGAAENERLVALLPGSRMSEVKCLAPRMAAVAGMLRTQSAVRFVAAAPGNRFDAVRGFFPEWVNVVSERAADALFACDAAVVKSGTATLEAAVIGTPQVVVYDVPRIGRLEWILLWMWKKNVPFIAMPNVILQRMAVQELLGWNCTTDAIATSVTALLEDEPLRARLGRDYAEIRRQLGSELAKPGSVRTAEILDEMLAQLPT